MWNETWSDVTALLAADIPMLSYRVTAAQSPYTAPGAGWYTVDCSSGPVVFTLPIGQGGQATPCFVKRADATYNSAGGVTFGTQSSQTIFDPTSIQNLAQQGQSGIFYFDGVSQWNVD